jgi:hypothetical protein
MDYEDFFQAIKTNPNTLKHLMSKEFNTFSSPLDHTRGTLFRKPSKPTAHMHQSHGKQFFPNGTLFYLPKKPICCFHIASFPLAHQRMFDLDPS